MSACRRCRGSATEPGSEQTIDPINDDVLYSIDPITPEVEG